jgi:hypothetical protein
VVECQVGSDDIAQVPDRWAVYLGYMDAASKFIDKR